MRIGILCSGGDAPGMNACVRAVVRQASTLGHEVVGIQRGYQGLLDEDLFLGEDGRPVLGERTVSGWSRFGGAFLRSSRSDGFRTEGGLRRSAATLERLSIEGLVAIGGDGTFRGCQALAGHWPGQILGCPGTIDNDLMGTDFTIGFATAVQTAVEAVDKIRDTAESHERMFLIEVMGRHSGFIAVYTALASAAETVCIPETSTDVGAIVDHLRALKARGKSSIMVIVAEGDEQGGAAMLNQKMQEAGAPFSTRVAVLGHLQRGGTPAPADRILGSQLGALAVRAIHDGQTGKMAGQINGRLTLTPFEETYSQHKPIPTELMELLDVLAS